jgi:DNA-directed RNA polymerase II subunit RPB2
MDLMGGNASPYSDQSPLDSHQHYDVPDGGMMMDMDHDEVTQADSWTIITAFFAENGLVKQQLDSFDGFVTNTMQEVVYNSPQIELFTEPEFGKEDEFDRRRIVVKFGQIFLSQPQITEQDSKARLLFPNQARLRQLTYVSFL